MLLKGKNIFLRLVEESDLKLLVEWRNRPDIWMHFFNTFPLSEATQKMWFLSLLQSSEKKLFMICTNENNKPIGSIGLNHIDFKNQSAEYGNVLIGEEAFLGKGYALEATRVLLDYSFNHLNLRRIYLFCYAENQRAIGVYKKCGFVKEGLLRNAQFSEGTFKDLVLMAVLQDEYKEEH